MKLMGEGNQVSEPGNQITNATLENELVVSPKL